jgi:uncharacterized protein
MNPPNDVPLFPLTTVLFPDGRLPLKIFEQRYMDMAKACLKNDSPFGVCLIASGRETGAPAIPHPVGTLARIVDWDMPQLGVLQVECRGERRFRIKSRRVEPSGLQRGEIELHDQPASQALSQQHQFLADLLSRIIDQIADGKPLPPYRFDDTNWVGCRLSEMLPMNASFKQELLELDDGGKRLEIIHHYLREKGLLNPSK